MSSSLPEHQSFPFKNRFSWPVFVIILLIHAVFLAFISTYKNPASSLLSPPMAGVLVSSASSMAEKTQGRAEKNREGKDSLKKNEKTNPRPTLKNGERHILLSDEQKKGADSNRGSALHSDGSSFSPGEKNANGSESKTFFSPRIDAVYGHNPKPGYPLISRRLGEEGTVILSVYILSSGLVDNILIKKSSGYPRLDQAAINGVKKWRYIPAKKEDAPVACWHTQAIRFSLKD